MWILVFITVIASEPEAINLGVYNSMDTCFYEREKLVNSVGDNGYFPMGQQAVCIQIEDD